MKAITVEPLAPETARLVSRREPPAAFHLALNRQPDDVKVVIPFAQA